MNLANPCFRRKGKSFKGDIWRVVKQGRGWLKIDWETDSRFGKQWCVIHIFMCEKWCKRSVGWEWKWRQDKVKTVREVKVKCQEMVLFIKRGGKGQVDYWRFLDS